MKNLLIISIALLSFACNRQEFSVDGSVHASYGENSKWSLLGTKKIRADTTIIIRMVAREERSGTKLSIVKISWYTKGTKTHYAICEHKIAEPEGVYKVPIIHISAKNNVLGKISLGLLALLIIILSMLSYAGKRFLGRSKHASK